MAGVNKATLLGNLGADPEIRNLKDGTNVANFTVATSETWNDKASGERCEKTEWHRVVIFGKLADVVAKYMKKGSRVYLEGKMQTRKWTDKEGVDRYTTEVIISGFGGVLQMLDKKGEVTLAAPAATTPSEAVIDGVGFWGGQGLGEEIPF